MWFILTRLVSGFEKEKEYYIRNLICVSQSAITLRWYVYFIFLYYLSALFSICNLSVFLLIYLFIISYFCKIFIMRTFTFYIANIWL